VNTGFRIKTGRTRGSYLVGDYNIVVRNMILTNVAQPVTAITPNVHDITISGLTATGATSESLIVGVPESCILDVNLDNVNITTSNASAGFQLRNMTGTFTNVNITNTRSGAPAYAVQENVNITAVKSPGLTTQVTSPLGTNPAGAPCGRYPVGAIP
jgi:hypothetical protein